MSVLFTINGRGWVGDYFSVEAVPDVPWIEGDRRAPASACPRRLRSTGRGGNIK